jgi:hypothetical protein
MRGIILQRADIFDPTSVPEYLEENKKYNILVRFKSLTNAEISLLRRRKDPKWRKETRKFYEEKKKPLETQYGDKLPPMKEIDEHIEKRLAAMSKSLYSHAIEYLKPLNISKISELQDAKDETRINSNIKTLEELGANIEKIIRVYREKFGIDLHFSPSEPFFKAVINPPVPIGSNDVIIEMHCDIFDIDRVEDRSERVISIVAAYDNPSAAKIGLRGLKKIYPEMKFDELLFILPMPKEVKNAFERAKNYDNILHKSPNVSEEEERILIRLNRKKNSKLLNFSIPHLQKLGIKPVQIKDFKLTDNFIRSYTVPVKSFDDVLNYVELFPKYHIPDIDASFDGRKIKLIFAPGSSLLYWPPSWKLNEMYNIYSYGVIIENHDAEGTLEDIFQSYISSSGRN